MKLRIADDLTLDILRLVDSRMLINANSGGGKSYLLRLIAERAAEQVQTIILDPEGEFVTLRERFDFILVGESGEIPCEPRSAALLARKLLELQANAVIDLYDLKLPERRRFVRLFLESLMHLPKTLWHPLLLLLDEAHLFAPERSAGDAESTQAVIDLMSQGRKRSYAGILATQRLSKLHKDAEAEANNVVIGRTWLDIDQERAGKLLGMKDRNVLRDLDAGNFYAFGPALSRAGVITFKADTVTTTHPKPGQRHKLTPPKPSDAVKRIVADLADLPQQAEAEVRDLEGAKRKITDLERQLRQRPKEIVPEVKIEYVEVPVLKNGQLDKAIALRDRLQETVGPLVDAIAKATQVPKATASPVRSRLAERLVSEQLERNDHLPPLQDQGQLPAGERLILGACIQYPSGLRRQQMTVLTGYKRSTRDAYISRLREKGFVAPHGDFIVATDAGIAALPGFEPLPTGKPLQDHWLAILPAGEKAILEILINAYPQRLIRDVLSDATGYQRSSRDAYISRLEAKELVDTGERGFVKASVNLFETRFV